MKLSKTQISCLVKDVLKEIPSNLNLDENIVKDITTIYFSSVDQEGFLFDFDQVWKWAGYATKSSAKRILTGKRGHLQAKEGVHYKIITNISENINSSFLLNHPVRQKQGENRGGSNKETILMTVWTFSDFCLASNTPQGHYLRNILLACFRIFKNFLEKINSHIVRENIDQNICTKRIKVGDSNKQLMQTVKLKKPHGSAFAIINGITNKTVTGRFKHETADYLGKKSKDVNGRDFMTKAQLAQAELLEAISTEINENDTRDPIEIHKEIADQYLPTCKLFLHGKIAEKPLKLDQARKSVLAIEEKGEKKREFYKIQNYFIKK